MSVFNLDPLVYSTVIVTGSINLFNNSFGNSGEKQTLKVRNKIVKLTRYY